MTTPSSGIITMQDINYEIGELPSSQRSLNDSKIRFLTSKPSGSVSFSDAYGKSSGYLKYIGTIIAGVSGDIRGFADNSGVSNKYVGFTMGSPNNTLTNKNNRSLFAIFTVKHSTDNNVSLVAVGKNIGFTSGIKINNIIYNFDYYLELDTYNNYNQYNIYDVPNIFVPGNSYDIFVD